MTNRTAAARYARALFDVALKERADLVRIEQELTRLLALFQDHPELDKALLNPAVPVPRKQRVVGELTTRLALSPVVAKLAALLAERDRLVLVPDLVASYRERLLDHQKVVRAEVTTAVPLPADRASALERGLAKLTGRTVTLSTKVDPTIIGGIVARIGSTVYDGSVTRQLEKMKERLGAGG
jgi:F-type H+-transporting ATPase subunit delta